MQGEPDQCNPGKVFPSAWPGISGVKGAVGVGMDGVGVWLWDLGQKARGILDPGKDGKQEKVCIGQKVNEPE